MQYYHNNKKVWKFEDTINMSSYETFIPLTTEQKAFYEAHPEASLQETLNCELYAPYIPPLEDYKALRISELSELSKITALQSYPQYVRDNIYSTVYEDSEERQTAMREYFLSMRNKFYRLKDLIEEALSSEEVDEIFNEQNFSEL